MNTCLGCGGVIGIDCFNPAECQWIAQQQQEDRWREAEAEHFRKLEAERYEDAMQRPDESDPSAR